MWRSNWREPVGQEDSRPKIPIRKSPRTPKAIPFPVGDIIKTVPANILKGEGEGSEKSEAKITDLSLVASYNWLTNWNPQITIPGKPPMWTPPNEPRKLQEDRQVYYIDRSAANYPAHPLEPAVVAVMKMHPNPCHVDIVACRTTIEKLLLFLRGDSEPFRMFVEVVRGTVHLIRREKSPKELVPGPGGYGHTFTEAYTTWGESVKRSSSHHRVIKYKFGGLDVFVRFDCKGYIQSNAEATGPHHGEEEKDAVDDMKEILGKVEAEITGSLDTLSHGFQVRDSGEVVPQEDIFDIKTRAMTSKGKGIGKELERLWITQTPTFVLARHQNGVFTDIRISNIRESIERWETEHQVMLRRLASLLRHIRNISQLYQQRQLEIVRPKCGDLEIRLRTPDSGTAFSQAVKRDWSDWLARGGSRHETTAEDIAGPAMSN